MTVDNGVWARYFYRSCVEDHDYIRRVHLRDLPIAKQSGNGSTAIFFPLAAIRIIILTVTENIINWPERICKPGHQKKGARRGESGHLTPHHYDNTLLN
jgi:hypothetical protein